jgi:putative peptide zinc metalloprotease protein
MPTTRPLRPDLLVFADPRDPGAVFVQDQATLDVYKFGAGDSALLRRLCSPEQLRQLPRSANAGAKPERACEQQFIARLHGLGLLSDAGPTVPHAVRPHAPSQHAHALPAPAPELRVSPASAPPPQARRTPPANSRRDRRWHLLDPTRLLDVIVDWLAFTRHLKPALALLLALTIIGLFANWHLIRQDLAVISLRSNLLQHLLLSLVTTSLASQLLKGAVARYYGYPVPSFGITLLLGVLPRFNARVLVPETAPKPARLWVAATGILARLLLFCAGFLLWGMLRGQGTALSLFGLTLGFLSLISLLFVANPLMGSAGYQLISTYFDDPGLRQRALLTLRYRRRELPDSVAKYTHNTRGLRVYALAAVLFTFGLIAFLTFTLATRLEFQYGGLGVATVAALAFWLFLNLMRRFGLNRPPRARLDELSGPRPARVARGKAVSEDAASPAARRADGANPSGRHAWRKYAVWLLLLGILLLPYRYEAGGEVVIAPRKAQEIYAQYPGIIERVHFNGGEHVERGVVLAEMSNVKERRDVEVTRARIEEQEQQLALLRTTPTAQALALAEEGLQTARIKTRYAEQNLKRIRQVFENDGIAYASYEEAMRELDLARQDAAEKAADLEALKHQISPHAIEAAQAKLKTLQQELAYYEEVLRRTQLRMPFAGRITTVQLQNLENKYLEDGDLFATVEDTASVIAEIAVPESDAGVVEVGSPARIRLQLLPHKVFAGEVSAIAPTTQAASYGRTVTVYATLDNAGGLLRSGMTGHAKVGGRDSIVAIAFSRALARFLLIEAWSWLP